MIWIVVTIWALLLVFVWALCRAAALADRNAERWALRSPRWADDAHRLITYSDEPRVRVTRGPYDHEAHGDFDAD